MLYYYIKIAYRNFQSNKLVFIGSLVTLCLGTLCISFLFSHVHNEFSMDNFHKRKSDIYMLVVKNTAQSIPSVFNTKLFTKFNYEEYPELESLVSISKYDEGELKFNYQENSVSPEGIIVDSTFFKIFDFKLKKGNVETLLANPKSLIITEKIAKTLFGNEDPIGKIITVENGGKNKFTVEGIIEKIPSNSSITFDFIIPSQEDYNMFAKMGGDFLLVGKKFDKVSFDEKIKHLAREHFQFRESQISTVPFDQSQFNKEKLRSHNIISRFIDKNSLYLQIFIMIVILVISVLNFSNIQIISINTRIKSSALKRINGANKKQIAFQQIIELVLLVGIAGILVSTGYILILPMFNNYLETTLTPSFGYITTINVTALLIMGLLGLIYPMMTSFKSQILEGLKNNIFDQKIITGRKHVVIFQYALTFLLLISSLVIYRQLQFMIDKDLGFKKENIIKTKIFQPAPYRSSQEDYKKFKKDFQFVKNDMASNSSIKYFSQGNSPLNSYETDWKRKDGEHIYQTQNTLIVTPNYEKAIGLKLVEGRFFDAKIDKSREKQIVINESAKKYWNISDISSTRLLNKFWDSDKGLGYEIIGVVKDFNYEHLAFKPQPLILLYMENEQDPFIIEFHEGATKSGLAYIENLFKRQNPNAPFNYTFLSNDVASLYIKEKQLGVNYMLFTIIALILSVIGLFTIAVYDTKRRVKEIAIRKVNGAKISEVLSLLVKGFTKWVVIAFLIGYPISYYLMHKWLENFAYKTALSWWIFGLAGVIMLCIALLTVGWQSYKAASDNPVKSLRSE